MKGHALRGALQSSHAFFLLSLDCSAPSYLTHRAWVGGLLGTRMQCIHCMQRQRAPSGHTEAFHTTTVDWLFDLSNDLNVSNEEEQPLCCPPPPIQPDYVATMIMCSLRLSSARLVRFDLTSLLLPVVSKTYASRIVCAGIMLVMIYHYRNRQTLRACLSTPRGSRR